MQCDSFNRNDMTCELQLSHNILAERHEKGADGGEGGSCSIGTTRSGKGTFFTAAANTI